MKKIMGVILAITLLLSVAGNLSVLAVNEPVLSVLSDGFNVPSGKKVKLIASSLPTGTEKVKFYSVQENGEKGEFIAESTASDAEAVLLYTLPFGNSKVIGEAVDSSDAVLSLTNTAELQGYYERESDVRWDVDFTDETIATNSWGALWYQVNKDGSSISSSSDTLVCHVGSENNMIETADTENSQYGYAMKMTAKDAKEVQLNEFKATIGGSVLKYEFDYMVDALPAEGDFNFDAMQPVLSGDNWLPVLSFKRTDKEVFFALETALETLKYTAEIDTWYNIKAYADIENSVLSYYIDDIYLGSVPIKSGSTNGQKIVSKIKGGAGTTVWIDNFKVSAVTVTESFPPALLTADAASVNLPVGEKVNVTASLLPEGTESVTFCRADADGNIIEDIETVSVSSGKAVVACPLVLGKNYFVAKSLNGDNSVLSKSNVASASAKTMSTDEVRWDVDFTDETIGVHRWGVPYYQVNKDGSSISSSGDTLVCHVGSASNIIEIADTGNAQYGYAMKMTAKDASQVQLNEFKATMAGSVLKYEFDYMVDALPAEGDLEFYAMRPVLSGGNWLSGLCFKRTGEELYFELGETKRTAAIDTWYNIKAYADLENSVVSYYINDIYLSSASFASGLTGGQKIVSNIANGAGTTVWIDNFKASAVKYDSYPDYSLTAADFRVDGVSVSTAVPGILTAKPTVTNNGTAGNIRVIVAVLDGYRLVNVVMCQHVFADGECEYTFDEIALGNLESGQKVRMMMWDDNMIPLDDTEGLE